MKKMFVIMVSAVLLVSTAGCGAATENTAAESSGRIQHFSGTVVDKEDFASTNYHNAHDTYFLIVENSDGERHKIRVTAVTFQEYSKGDTFDTHGHVTYDSIVE